MKKVCVIFLMFAFIATITGCGDPMVIDDVKYGTFGLINEDEVKNSEIQYELIVGNMVWGIILFETIIAPLYFFGFSLYEPVGKKLPVKGQVY